MREPPRLLPSSPSTLVRRPAGLNGPEPVDRGRGVPVARANVTNSTRSPLMIQPVRCGVGVNERHGPRSLYFCGHTGEARRKGAIPTTVHP